MSPALSETSSCGQAGRWERRFSFRLLLPLACTCGLARTCRPLSGGSTPPQCGPRRPLGRPPLGMRAEDPCRAGQGRFRLSCRPRRPCTRGLRRARIPPDRHLASCRPLSPYAASLPTALYPSSPPRMGACCLRLEAPFFPSASLGAPTPPVPAAAGRRADAAIPGRAGPSFPPATSPLNSLQRPWPEAPPGCMPAPSRPPMAWRAARPRLAGAPQCGPCRCHARRRPLLAPSAWSRQAAFQSARRPASPPALESPASLRTRISRRSMPSAPPRPRALWMPCRAAKGPRLGVPGASLPMAGARWRCL